MSSIATELNRFARQMDVDYNYHHKIAHNNKAYAHAIENTCKDNAEMAKEILKHTNAFYIKQDDAPRKGSQKYKPYIVCDICIDDSLVRSEVNLRREIIQYDLINQGLNIDEIRIIPAKGGMKQQHPFKEYANEAHGRIKEKQNDKALNEDSDKSNDIKLKELIENLETVKRALCKVFKEDTACITDKINAVILDYVPPKDTDKKGRRKIFYCLYFYSTDSKVREILEQNKCFIMSAACSLQLNVKYIDVHTATQDMKTLKAFPRNANPLPYLANTDKK